MEDNYRIIPNERPSEYARNVLRAVEKRDEGTNKGEYDPYNGDPGFSQDLKKGKVKMTVWEDLF